MVDKQGRQSRFYVDEDQPSSWFEPMYAGSSTEGGGIPWARMKPHASLSAWLDRNSPHPAGRRALVVGCGMGDDAIELESRGFEVTAFDVSESAIRYCQERFPDAKATFVQADLLVAQPQWRQGFDFVLEIFTVQSLPPRYEAELIENISGFIAPGGQLLVVTRIGSEERSFENGPPWLLTAHHVSSFAASGLSVIEQVEEPFSFEGSTALFVTTFARPVATEGG